MDDTSPWFFILAAFTIFAAIMVGAVLHSYRNQEMQRFAASWKGRIQPGGFFEPPGVSFRLEDLPASIEFTQPGDEQQTHLTVPLTTVRLRLELRPQTSMRQLGKYLGMQDIEIGDPEFDDAFIIQGSNPRLVEEFLAPSVRAAIMRIAHCGAYGHFDLHLILSGGSLRFTKHEHLSSEAQLTKFAQACRDLIRAIRQASQAGIEFIAAPQARPMEETECSVCGDPLKEKIVFCTKCKTPHHLDCWQYFGSCAVYGCGQKQYFAGARGR